MRNHLILLLSGAAMLLFAAFPAMAQSGVHGVVSDKDGAPLPGVYVLITGTTTGTLTGTDGTYSIAAEKGDELEFQCLGLTTVHVTVGNSAVVNVTMTDDQNYIDELVVVGYGTQKKSSLTSAVSAINGDELMQAPAANISQILAGRLSGISSVQESGEPGEDQASLLIRGSRSGVSYVVDGFPVSGINDLNPSDIESVSVLKDGASASVYGLRASGGVIIITTKKGEKGKSKITYDGSVGSSINANFPKFMNGPQFAYYYNVAEMMDQLASGAIATESDYVPTFTADNVAAMTNGDPTDGWDDVNYIDLVYGTGMNQKHNVTVQGGSDNTRYFISLGYFKQQGNIAGYDYDRYNMRANVESKIAERLTFNAGLSGVVGNKNAPRFVSGGSDGSASDYEVGWFSIAHQTIGMHPYLPIKYTDPATGEEYYTGTIANNQVYPYSPLAALYNSGYRKTRSFQGTANVSLRYDIPHVDGLYLKVSGSYDYATSYNKNLSTPYKVMNHKLVGGVWTLRSDTLDPADGNTLGEGSVLNYTMTGQASANYSHAFGAHNVDALLLAEIRDYKGNSHAAYAKNIPFPTIAELSNGVPASTPIAGYSYASRSLGYVFRLQYNYMEKYLAEVSGRYDGSYKFAGMNGTRWGFFPSASVGWRLSKEDFMKNLSWLDDLKLRASTGLLGNDYSVDEYMFLSTYEQWEKKVIYPSASGNTPNPAYYTSGIANKDLTWEKTLSWNAGFDAKLWGGLLGAEVDGFYNYTFDILSENGGGYPSSMGGYYPTYINNDAIDVRGIDVKLTHENSFSLMGKPFLYGIKGTISYSKTRWLKHNDSPNVPSYQKMVGTTYNSIWCWKADGLFRSEEEIDNSAWYGTRPNVGDVKYVDINGDGKIDSQDRGIFGRSNRPELIFGLNLNFRWNNFDFDAQFTGGALFDVSLTGTYFNGYDDNTIWTQTFKEGGNSPLFLVENAYSIYNTSGTFPRLTLGATGHGGDNGVGSTFWLRDGKYLRLKSCQIGYTLPKKVTDFFRMSALRVYVEGQNIFTIDGLPEGIDPESPGVNNGYYPQQLVLMGGVSISF